MNVIEGFLVWILLGVLAGVSFFTLMRVKELERRLPEPVPLAVAYGDTEQGGRTLGLRECRTVPEGERFPLCASDGP